jgi:hypothetical protein
MTRIVSVLILLISTVAFSQINYEQGYFIDNSGKKTDCLIKNLAWKNSPVDFEYKLTEDDEPKKGVIKNVKEFNVNAYKFRRYAVKIDRSSSELNKMDDVREPRWTNETLFLKVLVEGKATLYQFEESNLIKYFYSSNDHSVAEQLVYKEYKINSRIAENNYYKQQLYNIMKTGTEDISKYEKVKYKKDPLVNLFVSYNAASGGDVINLSEKHNKGSVNLKITPGVNFTSLSMYNNLSQYNFEFDSKATFRFGLEVEYIMPFNNNKWSLFIDPNYQHYKNEGEGNKVRWEADYTFIELPVGVRHYLFLNNKSKLFIDAAYVFALNMSDSYISRNNLAFQNDTTAPFEISKSSNFALGAGFSYSRYSIEARYNLNRGLLDLYSGGTEYSSIGIILGFKVL